MEPTTEHNIELPKMPFSKKNPVITINIPKELTPIDIVRNKIRKGEPLTDEEEKIIENYLQSDDFKAAADSFADYVKSIPDQLRSCFQLLNDAGKIKALEQIELLTKIPEYTKKDNE